MNLNVKFEFYFSGIWVELGWRFGGDIFCFGIYREKFYFVNVK